MYQAKNFDSLFGTQGFSDQLLRNHFTLYQGYVKNTNTLLDELTDLTKQNKSATPVYAELKRRFGWEYNGMRLHELYFGNMAKTSQDKDTFLPLMEEIKKQFGSFETWKKDFTATGTMRGIGWTILYADTFHSNRLFNVWINEHDAGHCAGCTPLVVLDVFEHAYMPDYGLKRADYIEAFFNAVFPLPALSMK
jgi:Fe-Mn family superoxide dismutase